MLAIVILALFTDISRTQNFICLVTVKTVFFSQASVIVETRKTKCNIFEMHLPMACFSTFSLICGSIKKNSGQKCTQGVTYLLIWVTELAMATAAFLSAFYLLWPQEC